MTEDAPRSPLATMDVLAMQEQPVTPSLDHVEIYTLGGLLTLLWHGNEATEAVVIAGGGAMGGLLGPAGLYHELGEELAAEGHGLIRLSYRRPNDLDACVHDMAAVADLASRKGARRFVTMGHSFGGAVAIRTAVMLGEHCRGVVTLATQSAGCEVGEQLAGVTPVLLFHGDRDELLPAQASELVQVITGGDLVVLTGAGHLLTESRDTIMQRLGDWLPGRLTETA